MQKTPNSTKDLICKLRLSGKLVSVFIHLTEYVIFQSTDNAYEQTWYDLVDEILKNESVFFVYEPNLEGSYGQFSRYRQESNDELKAKESLRRLFDLNANILPYRSRTDLTISIQDFLDNLENGVLLRLYVPNRQYQEEQLASFLRLLENYLQNIEKISFSIDVRKTENGQIYEFKSKDELQTENDLNEAIARFESFMEICQNDSNQARKILQDASISKSDLDYIISKYIREYRRLNLDINHEREQKLLTLKQSFESDILEGEFINADDFIPINKPSTLLSLPINIAEMNIAIGQIIYGDITYNAEDKRLLEFFEKHANKLEAITLKSSLDELKDVSSQKEKRKTAKQKIGGFLNKMAPIIGESVVKGLAKYLETLLMTGI